MPKYLVGRREVHVAYVEIEADSPEEAISSVADGNGDESDFFEYSHTLDPDTWTAEKAPQREKDTWPSKPTN